MEAREIKEKVLRIMALALEISPPIANKNDFDYPDIFVNYYANVSLFEVFAYEHGYASDRNPEKEWRVYLHINHTPDSCKTDNYFGHDVLDEILAYLEDLKNA